MINDLTKLIYVVENIEICFYSDNLFATYFTFATDVSTNINQN